jgi:hypothetical protein
VKPRRKMIVFQDRDGRQTGRVEVRETGSRGKHFSRLQPDGPLCCEPGCTELFQPICPNFRCAGSKVPRAIVRAEKNDLGTKRYEGHPALERERRASPKPTQTSRRPREAPAKRTSPKPVDLSRLVAKYGRETKEVERERRAA